MQDAQQTICLVSECPKITPAFVITPERNGFNELGTVNRFLILNAILGHQLAGNERAFIAGQQVMNVHSARINVFKIRAFQREDASVWSVYFCVLSNKMRGVIGRVEKFPVTTARV